MREPPTRLLSTSSLNSDAAGLPPPATSKTCMTAAMKRWRYLRRLLHYQQMDFEFAFWQMVYLLSNPRVVYKNFTYRKKTKAQFARDDPAFLVLLAGWLVISSWVSFQFSCQIWSEREARDVVQFWRPQFRLFFWRFAMIQEKLSRKIANSADCEKPLPKCSDISLG